MNRKLASVKDGSECRYLTARVDSRTNHRISDNQWWEIGRIYWPFAIRDNLSRMKRPHYDVTHLPSGYAVVKGVPANVAHALIRKLRATKASPNFTAPKGRIWKAAQKAWLPLAMPVQQKYGPRPPSPEGEPAP